MSLEILAGSVLTAIVPYLVKGGTKAVEKLGEKMADDGFDKRGAIWEKLKGIFGQDEIITLNLLEKYPNNEDLQIEVETKITENLEKHPDFVKEIKDLLSQLPQQMQDSLTDISITGNDNILNKDIYRSNIKINK